MQDSKRLFDLLTQYQIYLEALKNRKALDFEETKIALRREIRSLFIDLDVDTVDALTKRQLQQFLRKLRTAQLKHYDAFAQKLINDTKRFLFSAVETQQLIFEATTQSDSANDAAALPLSPRAQKSFWTLFSNSVVPSNGSTVVTLLQQLKENALSQTQAEFLKAYANRLGVTVALRRLTGSPSLRYADGVMSRVEKQAAGVSNVLLQHAASTAHNKIAANFANTYVWVSLLDSRTSAICRDRDGQEWRYNEGPLPPAHPNCRSYVVPSGTDGSDADYKQWLSHQSPTTQREVASLVSTRDGRTKVRGVLTLEEFERKVASMLMT